MFRFISAICYAIGSWHKIYICAPVSCCAWAYYVCLNVNCMSKLLGQGRLTAYNRSLFFIFRLTADTCIWGKNNVRFQIHLCRLGCVDSALLWKWFVLSIFHYCYFLLVGADFWLSCNYLRMVYNSNLIFELLIRLLIWKLISL
jgi:hypothetical protein